MGTGGKNISKYATNAQLETYFTEVVGMITVKQYGALGDGSTDDTQAILDAIDAVALGGLKSLYFPHGTYKVDKDLISPSDFTGIFCWGDNSSLSGITHPINQIGTNISLVTTFLGLTDSPGTYAGQAGKFLAVNTGETALEFASAYSTSYIDSNYYTQSQLNSGSLDGRYFTETELNNGSLDGRYFTETELNNGQLDTRYFTETELNNGQLDTRYYTETELDAGQLDGRYFTRASLAAGAFDSRYYTESELDGGQLNTLYYTKSQLLNGVIDSRYYTKDEFNSHVDGSSGCDLIGNTSFDSSPTKLQATLEWLKGLIDGLVVGVFPPGAIDNDMLDSDIKVGSLATLSTTEKGSVVGAVNEVYGIADDAQSDATDALDNIGDISTLDTTEKGSTVGAINEVVGNLGDVSTFEPRRLSQKTVTANGASKVSTTQSKFGGSSALFGASGDYLSIAHSADFDLGDGDFVIDFFVYGVPDSDKILFSKGSGFGAGAYSYAMLIDGSGFLNFLWYDGSSQYSVFANKSSCFTAAAWNHVAVVRSSNVIKMYTNGTSRGTPITFTDSINDVNTRDLFIGGCSWSAGYSCNTYIDEFRILKGVNGSWGSAIVVPTEAHLATNFTALLLHCNGTNNSTTFTDDIGSYANIVEAVRASEIDLNSLSGYVMDALDDIGVLDNLDTTEKGSLVGAVNEVAGVASGAASDIGTLGDLDTTEKGSLVGAINEVVASLGDGITQSYVDNGDLENSIEIAKGLFTVQAQMAAGLNQLSQMAIDAFNDSNGIASGSNYSYDNSNKLVKSTASIFTRSSAQKTVTANGNAQIDTAQKKIGNSSALFDGSGDSLSIPDSGDWTFGTNDFTIRFYFRSDSLPTNGNVFEIFNQVQDASNRWELYLINNSGTYNLYWNVNGTDIFYRSLSITTGTWYHIELCKTSGVYKLFLDGDQQGADVSDSTNITNNTGSLYIGGYYNGSYGVNGWLDEIEIAKGIARHTANFTPSTSALVIDDYTMLMLHCEGTDASTTFTDENSYTVDAAMTVISNAVTADSAPDSMFVVASETIVEGTITYSVSRDGGTTWTAATPETLVDVSGQPSGTSCKIKAVTSAVSADDIKINAWAFGWK